MSYFALEVRDIHDGAFTHANQRMLAKPRYVLIKLKELDALERISERKAHSVP
ncbi:hypothetical protein [Oceanospirillum sediminis]|uniref:Uncharacterized protein n=1 Tax=Oceanospirillum sediminis TaxID=2760088 RepID=A0A839IRA3_9GAMM|nr:hypothetical protein [Oceanospirillum sediminis]MBB1488013.1 hypothetical protein [Oceanospirillum sediminis]